MYLYSAFIVVHHTQGAQVQITQFYLQITPYLPLPPKRSPDGTSPDWDDVHLIASSGKRGSPSLQRASGGTAHAQGVKNQSWKPLAFGCLTELAKFVVLTVSGKLSICDVSTKLNRIPYNLVVMEAGEGSKNSKILLVNGAFRWHCKAAINDLQS